MSINPILPRQDYFVLHKFYLFEQMDKAKVLFKFVIFISNRFYTITEICEIRLDFDNFDITETTAGVCTDSFAVTGNSGQNPLDLCGTLTGFHCKSLLF